MTQANWSDDRVEQLKTLWTEGLSASQIARALGGVTRNAVIGKVHRLGLAGRASPSRSDRPRLPMAPKAPSVRSHVPAVPVVEEDPLQLEDGSHATVLTISDRMCRWPIGDPARRSSISAAIRPSRFALLRGPCPQGLSAAAGASRQQGQQGPDGVRVTSGP
jgi:GcrA cell cycle regulator